MAEIRPFRGLRYSAGAGPLDDLVAPPYDVLTPDERNAFAARNEHNVVHLTLPEAKADDRSKFIKYARSAALLSEWRREGALVLEPAPAFYRYTQTFRVGTDTLERVSLITLIKVEPFEAGVVLPHEQTFPKHKEDRLRILEATRTHLECIFGLYEDPGAGLLTELKELSPSPSVCCVCDGVQHLLEPVLDPEAQRSLQEGFADKRIWIADGHHRYETALAFRQALGQRTETAPEDYMVIALSSMSDPGLVLLPTHRVIPSLKQETPASMEVKLGSLFVVEEAGHEQLLSELGCRHQDGQRTIAIALQNGKGLLLKPKDEANLTSQVQGDGSERLKSLDVTVLHSIVFERLLGLSPTESTIYTRDSSEALQMANEGAGAAFLMTPPTVDDMKWIALGGERMPQKSTFYYPKVLSGLVIWSLLDF